MPEDIAPALLDAIRQDFERNLGGRQRAVQLLEKIQAGGANYADAGDYAEEVGAALADAFRANLSSDVLPDGRMYYNIADRVVRPLLEQDAGLGQGDPPLAPDQKGNTQQLLQVGQLPADGGLGHMELLRCFGDVAHFGHCQKIFQQPQVHWMRLPFRPM